MNLGLSTASAGQDGEKDAMGSQQEGMAGGWHRGSKVEQRRLQVSPPGHLPPIKEAFL